MPTLVSALRRHRIDQPLGFTTRFASGPRKHCPIETRRRIEGVVAGAAACLVADAGRSCAVALTSL
jgi:hypothetical protein